MVIAAGDFGEVGTGKTHPGGAVVDAGDGGGGVGGGVCEGVFLRDVVVCVNSIVIGYSPAPSVGVAEIRGAVRGDATDSGGLRRVVIIIECGLARGIGVLAGDVEAIATTCIRSDRDVALSNNHGTGGTRRDFGTNGVGGC